jgi:uncharacterized membrane protein YkvA (DUF1232 family)
VIVFGGLLVLAGAATLLWRDAPVAGFDPTAVGVGLIAVGLVTVAALVIRRRLRRARGEPEPVGTVIDRARALPRMIRAREEYGLPTGRLALWGFAVLYLISPVDVLPELLPVLGVTDDAGVAMWLLTSVSTASGLYLRWERERRSATPGSQP